MHPRKAIRNEVKALLLGKTLAGTRVFTNRQTAYQSDELPALSVNSGDEDGKEFDRSPRRLERKLNLEIMVFAAGKDDVDDLVDDISEIVERELEKDPTLNGKADDCVYAGTQQVVNDEGEKELGVAKIVFQVTYYTVPGEQDPVTADVFEKAKTTIVTKPGDAQTDIEGSVTLPI